LTLDHYNLDLEHLEVFKNQIRVANRAKMMLIASKDDSLV